MKQKAQLPRNMNAGDIAARFPVDGFRTMKPERIAKILAQHVRDAEDGLAANGEPISIIIQRLLRHHDPIVRLGTLKYCLDVAKEEAALIDDDDGDDRPVISAEPLTEEQWLAVHSPKAK